MLIETCYSMLFNDI